MPITNGQTAKMFKPVSCNHCRNGIYDIGKVDVTVRYADCSMWKTPCCGVLVDDRGETGWKPSKDYEVIDKSLLDADDDRVWGGVVDVFGMRRW